MAPELHFNLRWRKTSSLCSFHLEPFLFPPQKLCWTAQLAANCVMRFLKNKFKITQLRPPDAFYLQANSFWSTFWIHLLADILQRYLGRKERDNENKLKFKNEISHMTQSEINYYLELLWLFLIWHHKLTWYFTIMPRYYCERYTRNRREAGREGAMDRWVAMGKERE